jgi:hypothetical protein
MAERKGTCPDQKVNMVGHQAPGETLTRGFLDRLFEPLEKLASIVIVEKNIAFFDTPIDDMKYPAGHVQSSLPGHNGPYSKMRSGIH